MGMRLLLRQFHACEVSRPGIDPASDNQCEHGLSIGEESAYVKIKNRLQEDPASIAAGGSKILRSPLRRAFPAHRQIPRGWPRDGREKSEWFFLPEDRCFSQAGGGDLQYVWRSVY
jgi:hypothetical protein